MTRRIQTLAAAALLLPLAAWGQRIPLWSGGGGLELDFDAGRLWSYSLYEQSRWGAGLTLTAWGDSLHTVAARRYSAYAGHSHAPRQWVGGAGAGMSLGPAGDGRWLQLAAMHDYEAAASRRIAEAHPLAVEELAAFMSRRMALRSTLAATYAHPLPGGRLEAEARWWRGWRLYDGGGLLYPRLGDTAPREDGLEGRLTLGLERGLAVGLQAGTLTTGRRGYLRMLAHWNRRVGAGALAFRLHAQGGAVSAGAPYAALFDLGGTLGAPVYFTGSLLTARPGQLAADRYAMVSARVEPARPLCSRYSPQWQAGTAPLPFASLTAAIGSLRGQDGDGRRRVDGLDLQAPHRGYAEAAAGIDGALRWGAVDWGAAAAFRLHPQRDADGQASLRSRTALMLTAKLRLPPGGHPFPDKKTASAQ